MKKLFIFKIHEKCSYRDGMIVVVAFSFKEAKQFLLDLTDDIAFGLHECGGEKFIDDGGIILEFKVEHLDDTYSDHWYLAENYELKDTSITSGVKHVAYHDG